MDGSKDWTRSRAEILHCLAWRRLLGDIERSHEMSLFSSNHWSILTSVDSNTGEFITYRYGFLLDEKYKLCKLMNPNAKVERVLKNHLTKRFQYIGDLSQIKLTCLLKMFEITKFYKMVKFDQGGTQSETPNEMNHVYVLFS